MTCQNICLRSKNVSVKKWEHEIRDAHIRTRTRGITISYLKSHLRVAFVIPSWNHRVVFQCNCVPSVGIVMTSAVDWLISKFGTNFARNSNFHIRMTILCQLRDSVTPALEMCSHCILSICNIYLFLALVLRAGFAF